MTFHGDFKSSKTILLNVKESPKVMTLPLFLLAIGSIFSGIFLTDFFIGKNSDVFWYNSIILAHEHHHYMPFSQTLLIKSSVAIGILAASLLYFYNKNLSLILSKKLSFFYLLSLNKWYVDELYRKTFVKPIFYLATFFWKKGDINTIDTYGPNGASKIINIFSKSLSIFQSGYLYHYAFAMLGGLVIILSWFIFY